MAERDRVARNGEAPKTYFVPIVSAGFFLRLAVALSLLRHDPRQWFFTQTTELSALAQSLLTGHGLSSPFGGDTGPSAFLAPGYPALVALVFRLFGSYSWGSGVVLLLLEVVFATLTVLIIMLATRKAFGSRTANIAGGIWAISPPLLWLPAVFWESCLSTLLLAGFLALVLHWSDRPRAWRWVAMGAYCALAMLVNPSLMLALFAMLLWTAYRSRRTSHITPLLALITCIVIFLPWPVRNMHALHAFIPMRSNMGYELWQGNRPGSNGSFSAALHPNVNRQEFARYAALGEVGYMREKSALAQEAIRANPSGFLRATVMRVVKFWAGLGSQTQSALIVTHIVFTTFLGFAGLFILMRRRLDIGMLFLGPMLLFPLPYYLTHPDFRFRLVLDPIATLLSAYAIAYWSERRALPAATRTL